MKLRTVRRYYRPLFLVGVILAIAGCAVVNTVFVRAVSKPAADDITWSVDINSVFTKSPSQLFWGKINADGDRDEAGDISAGGSGGKHTIRDTPGGRNNKVSLRLYYTARPSDGRAGVLIDNVQPCNLDADEGELQVLGSNSSVPGVETMDMMYHHSIKPAACSDSNLIGRQFKPVLRYDIKTEKWIGDITIQLTGDQLTKEQADAGQLKSMRFTVKSTDGGYIAYRHQDGSDGTAYGVNVGGQWKNGTKVVVPFGLPCNQDDGSGLVKIYDPEIGAFGPSYVKIFYKDRDGVVGLVPKGRNGVNGNVKGGSADKVSISSSGVAQLIGNNGETSIITVSMKKGYRYAMVFYNPEDGARVHIEGTNNPKEYRGESTSNTISFSVPTDSIGGLINCNYNLTPHISINKSSFPIETNLGPEASVTEGAGAVAGGIDHEWRVSKAVFSSKPTGSMTQADNTSPPCYYLGTKGTLASPCETVGGSAGGSGKIYYPGTQSWRDGGATGEIPIGHWVCYMTSVKQPAWDSDEGIWRHSVPVCAVSGISPKVQVWGGDLKTTQGVVTSMSSVRSKTYGSWGEYGVMASGVISNVGDTGMASGAGLNGGSTDGLPDRNQLTFANTPSYGGFGAVLQNPQLQPTDSSTDDDFDDGHWGKNANKVYDLRGKGVITIGKNLEYDDSTYKMISQIPRVVILADSFAIKNSVTRIDPWLIATGDTATAAPGVIYTCEEGVNMGATPPTPVQKSLSIGMCGNQLTFNGPVYADKIYLSRTGGSRASDLGKPAEIFNLRADAYLSAIAGNSDTPVATTDSVVELPPRF